MAHARATATASSARRSFSPVAASSACPAVQTESRERRGCGGQLLTGRPATSGPAQAGTVQQSGAGGLERKSPGLVRLMGTQERGVGRGLVGGDQAAQALRMPSDVRVRGVLVHLDVLVSELLGLPVLAESQVRLDQVGGDREGVVAARQPSAVHLDASPQHIDHPGEVAPA
jgi:hypothetical protein